ncbi:uncharacterized protein LOC113336033 [Papaver somniferum]|uniref:uncharacterized protein LOC113336033 n=1 Tax=Papaver somniferum TaxID=3469 RepID=UPI000E6F9653|nr:uncharacterized protein LOC113336033 [Papaver somniferum]
MIAKLGWRLLTEPSALWVSQLKPRYFRNSSVFKAKIPTTSFWIWKCISKGILLVEQNRIWEIWDGNNTNIWDDNWTPNLENNLSSFKTTTNSHLTLVKDLLDPVTKKWNFSLLIEMFPMSIANKINNVRIAKGKSDTLRWLLTKSGVFTVKSMYNELTEKTRSHYNLGQPDSFWNSLWNLNFSQRIKIFAWKCLQNALSTNLKLEKFIEDIHPDCPLNCKKNTIIPVEIALTKAWFIWKERCNLVFENKQYTSAQLGSEIQRYLELWYKDHPLLNQVKIRGDKTRNWNPPKRSQLKLNIDAASTSAIVPAGFSLILRNDAGILEQGRAGAFIASTSEEAEALGLLQGAKRATKIGLSNFSIEGDCKNLFDHLNGNESSIEWKNITILDDAINELKSCNNFLGFYFVSRTTNNVADLMAKKAKNFSSYLNWMKEPPECIRVDLEVDKSNVRADSSGSTLPICKDY